MKRLVGLLGWLGVVLVLAAVALRFIRPALTQWYQGLALAGLIVTAVYALSQWREIGRSFQGKNVKYGSFALGSVVVFLGILVAVNWIANRQNKRWDLTSGAQFSLSEQTKQILTRLDKPVTFRVFHGSNESSDRYRDQLSEYQYLSKQVSVQYYEADRTPVEAEKYGITTVPTILIEYEGRTERTTQADEQGLTNALKKAIEGKAKKVYFAQGHGEHDPTAGDPAGFKNAADALAGDNFEVAPVTIIQAGKVPDDASVLVVAGPTHDFLAPELDAVRAYLKRGGKLLLMIDPPGKDLTQPVGLMLLAKEWGVELGTNVVLDVSGIGQLMGTTESWPVGMPLPHPITTNFRQLTAYPLARSATPIEGGTDGKIAQKLLQTQPQSWAEADLKGLYATGRPERNLDKGDVAGPISIAAAVSAPAAEAPAAPAEAPAPNAPKPETRVVIVGDSDFAANRAFALAGNNDLFLNMANWLAQQEDLIAIRPKDPEDRRIQLTQDESQRIFWITIFIIPGLLFANAVRVWWKRR